jgi:hypothetical protein
LNAEAGISTDVQGTPKTVLTINFGADGNSNEYTAGGWSHTEPAFRWMTGVESELRINQSLVDGDYIIDLDLVPFLKHPALRTQRLTVAVNGTVIGQSTIAHEGRLGYRIPAAALAGQHFTSIVLMHPDAARPSDFGQSKDPRSLSVSLKRLSVSRVRHGASTAKISGTGGIPLSDLARLVNMTPASFIMNFESLGDNCEFGLVQRRCGAEPFLSLLRFAGMDLRTLLRALDGGLLEFGDPANVEIHLDDKPRPEYVVHEKRYGVIFHTFRYEGEIEVEGLRQSESKRLAYYARRFVGDLKRGKKIFVIKRNVALGQDEILPLYNVLSSFGPNVLLWMVPADAEHASGSVEVVIPGLLKGYIERFAPHEDATTLLLDHWLAVCANAYQLTLADGVTSQVGTESCEEHAPA